MTRIENRVNLTDEEIESYCKKYNLKRTRYNDEKLKLEQKKDKDGKPAYSEEKINQLILRRSSKKTVEVIIRLHDELMNYGVSPAQIYSMVAHGGGSKNLDAFIHLIKKANKNNQTLESCFGLTLTKIVQLLSQPGGAKQLYEAISKVISMVSCENQDIQIIKELLISESYEEQDLHDVFSCVNQQPLPVTGYISSQNDNINHTYTNHTTIACLPVTGDGEEERICLFDDVFDSIQDLSSITNLDGYENYGFFGKFCGRKRRQDNDNTTTSKNIHTKHHNI